MSLQNKNRTTESSVAIDQESPDSDRILVGIPAYNEEIGIGSTILAAQQYSDTVVVVDDGSTDNTVSVAAQTEANVIEHNENVGKGGAVQTIFEYAYGHDFDALVLLDADGQHVPEEIPDVAQPVLDDDVDMTIGSRYVEADQTETPLYRRFGQQVLDVLTTGSTNSELTDTQSGFRAFSPEAVDELTLSTDGIGVESEMISEAAEKGLELDEVPIDVRYEGVDGQTYNPLQHGLTVVMFVLQLIRDRHPLLFFGVPGILLLLGGSGLGLQSAYLYQTTGAFHQWRVISGGFGILLGTLCVFCALMLSQIRNMVVKINE